MKLFVVLLTVLYILIDFGNALSLDPGMCFFVLYTLVDYKKRQIILGRSNAPKTLKVAKINDHQWLERAGELPLSLAQLISVVFK